ncbi:Transcription-associated protein 1 [Cyphellophora attinorum]|uniref:Transcription-associated protein 1 n=1 Tax=Cyphellophora attinorum TaxID=1664694 RepID=A0A0N0NP24_9EURO|nr:Transcription-associated protein 1 [Phialophora attinorum]KPI42049.1 Transcription-associated protein 1 [Phialophora attinorum]
MASEFVTNIARHFTIIELGQSLCDAGRRTKPFDVNSGEGAVYLSTKMLADVLVDCFASENAAIRAAAEAAMFTVRDTARTIFGQADKAAKFPFFYHMAQTFCQKCREVEWFTKAGASLGLQIIVTKLDLGSMFLSRRHLDIVKALLFVIKDTPQDVPASTRITAQETLYVILKRICQGINKESISNEKNYAHQMSVLLSVELSHMNKHVRATAQRSFSIMAEQIGVEVYELIAPVKERLLAPIFNKPLRALPFLSQTGFIDAITYCLELGHDLVPLNDQLNRLTMESLALADAESDILHAKPEEFSASELIVSLRVRRTKLKSLEDHHCLLQAALLKVSRSYRAAHAGLKEVLEKTNKLPKDLLQNGLRPILMNLQDPKKLTVAGLDGLARLLTLLTNYFKVEIGSRLLEHLDVIAEESLLQKVSFGMIEQNPQMKIVAAIVNIFHLLPPTATQFMAKLVNSVLDLESKLRRTTASPFRQPLVLYLNKYPKDTLTFFQGKLQEEKYGRFFAQILSDTQSEPLREMVMAEIDAFSATIFDAAAGEGADICLISGILATSAVCASEKASEWIADQLPFVKKLLEGGQTVQRKLRQDELQHNQRLRAQQAGDALNNVLITYLSAKPTDIDFAMDVFTCEAEGDIKASLQLNQFIYKKLIKSESTELQRSLIERSLDIYTQKAPSQKLKTFLLHNIVNPIVAEDIQRARKDNEYDGTLMNKAMFDTMHEKLWKTPGEVTDDNSQPGIDHSRMEVLQLSAFMLKYHSEAVSEYRKDVIKFAWAYIRLEDVINKYAAYVLISYFIRFYEAPAKLVQQIYMVLLRAHQNEGKALVTQALEVLAPILPVRTPNATPGDKRTPPWARLPKKVLNEESGNLQQVQSIFNFVVRQADLFYEYREFFIPTMIQMLHKIAAPPNPSSESKKLALSLINLIAQWEKRRVSPKSPVQSSESPAKKRDSITPAASTPDRKDKPEYQIPIDLRTMVVKYMITFVTALQERFPVPATEMKARALQKAQQAVNSTDMVKKAVQLLQDLVSPQLWADVDVGLYPKLLDPMLAGSNADKPDEKHLTCMVNTLQVMRILLATKSNDWKLANIELIQKLLEKPLKSEDPEIQDCIHWVAESSQTKPLLVQVLEAIPEVKADDEDAMDLDSASAEFLTKFSKTIIGEGLSAINPTAATNNLWTLAKVRPSEVDEHMPGLMRVFQTKLAKDHIGAYMMPTTAPPPNWRIGEPLGDAYEFSLGVDLVKKSIDIMSARMATLGEQRRPYLSVLASLVEKSYNAEIANKILDVVENWIFNSSEAWPTLKEKTAVLHKMLVFERWPNQSLLERFLELVIKIYEDPTVTRTELTVRLEHAFLIGTRAKDVETRTRFMTIFNRALSETANFRIGYVLTQQNWDTLADSFWLKQASQLIMGSIDMTMPARLHPDDITICPVSQMFSAKLVNPEQSQDDIMIEESLEEMVSAQRKFNEDIRDVKVRDLLEPLTQLQHTDDQLAYDVWVTLFPLCWSALTRDERLELEKGMVTLLTREYHQRQLNHRPNVVQALLEGVIRARPRFKVPPHVLKFLSRTYDAWYTGLTALEESTIDPLIDTAQVRESNLDALVEIYASLQEDDLFYGTWRRRCKFMETNSALSYEQHGMWDKAQHLWEAAQVKARTGVMPFSQGEYYIWEDHWVMCAQKLQQWDILGEFAKHENFNDLLLESAWRNYDAWSDETNRAQLDNMIKSVSDAPTPRRTFFQAFMALLKYNLKQIGRPEFQHICDEATQLSIRKWHQLPRRITNAHIPILQNFQQLVELHDGSVICDSLMSTNERNLDSKSQEVKLLLQAWRDRLPNVWDDINAWQDLVTWRQHVFQLVNDTYLKLLPPGGNQVGNNSYAFRGYHETAWIINKFAHVARKHQMPEVCINQLGKIYTLPNIEIQEAFLKLREQAKCHYQNKSELNNGLDVINNTNLNYFGAQQKAEFYTLKGMFLAKLQHAEDANEAFGVALYYDLRLPKAWAEWGQYSDRKFKENPGTMEAASNAVSCYLEAAGLYKSAKSRKMLSRVLWLLSLDDEEGQIAKAFEDFKGDTPVWYWTTFIPQLLGSLEHKEARLASSVLSKIAKVFPQALFYHLRAAREDLSNKRKQQEQRSTPAKQATPAKESDSGSRPGTANGDAPATTNGDAEVKPKVEANGDTKPEAPVKETPKKPWEHAGEIMDGLKTGFPLLALSMETMTDQLSKHFKCPPDEDAHRLIVALLNDGLNYVSRSPQHYAEGAKLPASTEANIQRFVASVLPAHIRGSFEAEFVKTRPTMYEYIQKLTRWRDKFENKLDHRQQWAPLESYSHHLSEFKFLKFDDMVEVPGQYQQHKDNNKDFVRIERFMPTVELVRGNNICHRRITLRGHDGSLHPFAVQHPTGGKVRREERIVQLFRIFNQTLAKRKEARRRNLYFHLPIFVPIAPPIRLVQDDASYVTLQTIYEDYVANTPNMSRDEPMLFLLDQLRSLHEQQRAKTLTNEQQLVVKTEIFNKIQSKWAPNTIALNYFKKIYPSFADFWLFRRQFAYQYATTAFMTHVMHMTGRYPMKMAISRSTGDVWAVDALPTMSVQKPLFWNNEAVPFRLTPNLQTLIGPLAVEGIFTASLMAIARCLAEPDNGYEMAQMLSVFVRDEVIAWIAGRAGSSGGQDKMNSMMEGGQLRELVGQNCEIVVKKALFLGVTQHDVGAAGSAPNVNGVNGSSGNGEGSSSATASAANGATGATGSTQAGAVQPPAAALLVAPFQRVRLWWT